MTDRRKDCHSTHAFPIGGMDLQAREQTCRAYPTEGVPRVLRHMTALLVVLLAGCSSSQDDKKDATPPTGAYVKVYAMAFVEAMRTDGVEAGAFEISKRPEADGFYHLGVDVVRDGNTERMEVLLRPEAGGLRLERMTAEGDGAAWHAAADKAAREEEAE